MTWRPGDPIHTIVDGVTRPMFQVLDVATSETCTPCPDAASWPNPGPWNELPAGDEIGRVIREAKESAA